MSLCGPGRFMFAVGPGTQDLLANGAVGLRGWTELSGYPRLYDAMK